MQNPPQTPIQAAVHNHTVGYTGMAVALIGIFQPVFHMLTDSSFVADLISHDPAKRNAAVLQLVIAAIVAAAGALAALSGKGPLSSP